MEQWDSGQGGREGDQLTDGMGSSVVLWRYVTIYIRGLINREQDLCADSSRISQEIVDLFRDIPSSW